MAPQGPPAQKGADAKAKAKAEGKAKPKKEKKVEEDEAPKMQAPDYEAFQETVQKVQDQIDKLQKDQQALTAKINEKSVGKEDFFAKKAVIRAELDEVSKEMDMYSEKRDKIRAALGEKKTENAEMKAELGKMKKSMAFTSEADIDARLAAIEKIMSQTSISLKDEKAYMVEIKELKKNKPKVAQLGQMQDNASTFDAGKDLVAQKNQLNEQMAILREKKKGIQDRLTEVTEARKAQMGDFGGVAEERDTISTKIKELIAQRSTMRDAFNNAKREFQSYLAEQRRIKQENTRKIGRYRRNNGGCRSSRSRWRHWMSSPSSARSPSSSRLSSSAKV